jgi:hypothetical protein
VLVGATTSAVLVPEQWLDSGCALALLAGYGFDATAARAVAELGPGVEPALTFTEPGGHHLLLDHDVFDLGTVHVAFDGLSVEHVHLDGAHVLRKRRADAALLASRGTRHYSDEELVDRLISLPIVGAVSPRALAPDPVRLPAVALLTITGDEEPPG